MPLSKRRKKRGAALKKAAPVTHPTKVITTRTDTQSADDLIQVVMPRHFWETILGDAVASGIYLENNGQHSSAVLQRAIARSIQKQTEIEMVIQ